MTTGHLRLRLAATALVFVLGASEGARTHDEATGLVVHEWGTFTSVLGDDGRPVAWRPFTGSDDLPGFVYRAGPLPGQGPADGRSLKWRLSAPARLETPVLYFYADQPSSVSARVRFPAGRITEWYPQARVSGDGIDWDALELQPGAPEVFPDEGAPSHYYAARDTDAAPVRVEADTGSQDEKFLFYRGAGSLDLSVRALVEGDALVVEALHPGVREVVLFESRSGDVGYSIRRVGERPVAINRPFRKGDVFALRNDLVDLLVRHGLYPKEARAMVATWGDSWFEEGTRLFFVLPRAVTDRVLPLTVSPRPTETVRVLVGRLELVLREDEQRVRDELLALGDSASLTSAEKADFRARLGRFGEPTLQRLLDHAPDPALRAKVAALLPP